MDQKELFIGKECQGDRAALLNLSFPIQEGMVMDWDNMEKIWSEVFYEGINVVP